MRLKSFAESIIFQSLEDLWDAQSVWNSVDFFASEDFHIIATMAGMDINERISILKIVNKVIRENKRLLRDSKNPRPKRAGRAKKPPLVPCLPPQSATAHGGTL